MVLKDVDMDIKRSSGILISFFRNDEVNDIELYARTVPLKRTPGKYHIQTVGPISLDDSDSDDGYESEIILSGDLSAN